jgi:iron complex transport system ATP-binding protein
MSFAITGLTFGYGTTSLFKNLSVSALARGSVTALIGPNGAGKSSLFRLVTGLVRPRSGTITLDGADLAQLSSRRRAERVFLLTQHTAMRAMLCVFDVVLLARRSMVGESRSAGIVRVEAVLEGLGIDHLSDRPVCDLSGGQQQLVALAQALVRDPDVLLLDEPTSALDLRRQLEVLHLVRKLTYERGLVTIAALHDLAFASRFADRFLLLHSGRVAVDGDPADVLADPLAGAAYGVRIRLERTSRGDLVVDPYLGDARAP